MTLLASDNSVAVPTTVPVVASTALRQMLIGPSIEGVVLGASSKAVWIEAGGDCVILEAPEGARLPNAVALGVSAHWLPALGAGERLWIGDGQLAVAGRALRVARWWDPRPALPALDRDHLKRRVVELELGVEVPLDQGLEVALTRRDPGAVVGAAEWLIGRGDGLTPAGDDLLAGALAGMELLGGATGDDGGRDLVAGIEPGLMSLARLRTTLFSAALLRHACAGRVAGPVAALLGALAGRGQMDEELRSVVALGHSSGAALAAGTLIGARALIGGRA